MQNDAIATHYAPKSAVRQEQASICAFFSLNSSSQPTEGTKLFLARRKRKPKTPKISTFLLSRQITSFTHPGLFVTAFSANAQPAKNESKPESDGPEPTHPRIGLDRTARVFFSALDRTENSSSRRESRECGRQRIWAKDECLKPNV